MSLVLRIERIRREKWKQGCVQYRGGPDAPFVGDPVREMLDEIADLHNYLEEAVRQSRLMPETANRIDDALRECVIALEHEGVAA